LSTDYTNFGVTPGAHLQKHKTPPLDLRNGVYYPYSLSPFVKVDENYQMRNLSIINMAIVKDIIMLKEDKSLLTSLCKREE